MLVFLQSNYGAENFGGFFVTLFILIGIAFYFLPTIIAFIRKRHNKIAIGALNFFLGWSLIGWVVALIWSLSSNNPNQIIVNSPSSQNTEDDLDKLHKLKRLLDEGAISQEEYEAKKRILLR